MTRRRYAFVGLGHRAQMYVDALLGDWSDTGEIVALCDPNRTRMDYYNDRITAAGGKPVPCYAPEQFTEMLQGADTVVVTSVDATHARYVCAALEAGRDVVVEKPLTVDAAGCAAIAEAAARSTGKIIVTFNYRYSPRNSAVRRLIADGRIGEVTSVHFEWTLDTIHGADYFRRWHRDRANSGGLLVHKSTHHFDLVNWWLGARAELVFAQTALRFYGDANASARGLAPRPERGQGAPGLGSDPFILDISRDERLKRLYLDAEHEDGYLRDQDVFAPGITIDDTMSLLVRYDSRTVLTYSLTAYAPWEGYRVAFNGTEGRIELAVCERAWTPPHAAIDPSAAGKEHAAGAWERLTLHRHWEEPQDIPVEQGAGGHGGGDRLLLDDVFRGPSGDPLARQAGFEDGIRSVLIGAAGNESARTGLPVRLTDGGTRLLAP
ncbi:Gfo/Idh/MocA family protein [Streptomyces aidingensis]|uniref:Oxidoreductase family, NAD-binding Rossmann fold n=1 Tax=Streptomyces aidingensis TaxID=910347 RepID=A0A1I1M7K7_9ACTN|nr:Gfo/Idh/MocA family oxidoreductase [Streptomyces aidingensis]SFC81026.1 Oxidoreductase family, NAD-binding Rossmann fold [Streptomyces aidingensis]